MSKAKDTTNYNKRKVGSSSLEDEGLDTLLREDTQENSNLNKIEYNRKK